MSCFNVFADENNSFGDLRSAGRYMRESIKNRQETVTIEVPTTYDFDEAYDGIMYAAFEETYDGKDGDYLKNTLKHYSCHAEGYGRKYIMTYTIEYRTTAEQEQFVDEKAAEILESLDIDSLDDYEKLTSIYDYVINNVEYANSSDALRYTAYGALSNGEAVCQGISQLLYRLVKDAGISCRMISGTAGGGHMWNIASVNGVYYLLDSTWDINRTEISRCNYFMKGISDFDDYDLETPHIPDDDDESPFDTDFTSAEFKAMYPISEKAYDPESPAVGYVLADANSDGIIDSNDATQILSAYAMLSTGNMSGLSDAHERAADVNLDGMIDSSDASLVLNYYAYASTGGDLSFEEFNSL